MFRPLALLIALAGLAQAAVVEATEAKSPSRWALLERRLIDQLDRAGELFVHTYSNRDGTLRWKERYEGGMNSSDDSYEGFRGLSLAHITGGSPRLDVLHREVWEGITKMFTRYGQIYREFDSNWDWMHHGEGYTSFYTLGLARPDDPKFRDRARRFAAMFTGDDPEAPNYDPAKNMMRAVMNGSRGPKMEWNTRDWIPTNANLTYYHLPYDDIPGVTTSAGWINDAQFAVIVKTMSDRMARGDVPINLTSTPLIATAYLYTGDDKYKQWITRYIQGWEERTRANNGITPDNIGLSGKPGEYTNGNWWGGYYGWRWPRGGIDVIRAEITAARVAQLLTGEDRWFDLPRSQIAVVRKAARAEKGVTHVPQRYDQRGWNSWAPEPGYPYARIWLHTFAAEDQAQVDRWLSERKGRLPGPESDFEWIRFLRGQAPDYPEQAFQRDLDEVQDKVAYLLEEHGDPETWVDSKWADATPMRFDSLVRLTMGSIPVDVRGEMLYGVLRYFDPDRSIAGLPRDVAALITRITRDEVEFELVNTSLFDARNVIVQAGTYGEHRFTRVNSEAVDANWFEVRMRPGSAIRLKAGLKRHANRPAYAWTWKEQRR